MECGRACRLPTRLSLEDSTEAPTALGFWDPYRKVLKNSGNIFLYWRSSQSMRTGKSRSAPLDQRGGAGASFAWDSSDDEQAPLTDSQLRWATARAAPSPKRAQMSAQSLAAVVAGALCPSPPHVTCEGACRLPLA